MDQDAVVTAAAIPTVLVTGFLGAGKTTVINRLITHIGSQWSERPGRLAVMINEFASIGIDGALVPDAVASLGEGYVKIELNRGSIFCACMRTDFIAELRNLVTSVRPDMLLVEATGIARVDDLYRMMRQDRLDALIRIVRTICVADAVNFHKVAQTLEAVGIQARYADTFILNKVDRADASLLELTERLLRQYNAAAPIYRAVRGDVPLDEVLGSGTGAGAAAGGRVAAGADDSAPIASEPDYHSASMQFSGVFDRAKWAALLGALGPARLLRAKGVIVYADGPRYFEVVNGEYSETEAPASLAQKGVSIFTFVAEENVDALSSLVRRCRVEG